MEAHMDSTYCGDNEQDEAAMVEVKCLGVLLCDTYYILTIETLGCQSICSS